MLDIYIEFIKDNTDLILVAILTFLCGIGVGAGITDLINNIKENK